MCSPNSCPECGRRPHGATRRPQPCLDGGGDVIIITSVAILDELASIPAGLLDLGARCVAGVATHEHYDHVMWHPGLGEVPRWATPGTVTHLAEERDRLLAPLAQYLTPDLIDIAGRLQALPGEYLPWDGPAARCVVHDAHAPAHLALLVEEGGVLVAGDMLSDVELPMQADDKSLERYAVGLEALLDSVQAARALIPGHGTVTLDPRPRYEADMRYLDDLLAGRTSHDPRIRTRRTPACTPRTWLRPRSLASGGELLQGARRVGDTIDGHEQVVVEVPGDDVAADPLGGERPTDGGRQSDGRQGRVHLERDPPGDEVVGPALLVRDGSPDHAGHALVLPDGGLAVHVRQPGERDEDVLALAHDGLQRGDQSGQVGLAAHEAPPPGCCCVMQWMPPASGEHRAGIDEHDLATGVDVRRMAAATRSSPGSSNAHRITPPLPRSG